MKNLLEETCEILFEHKKMTADVKFVAVKLGSHGTDMCKGTWKDFQAISNFTYDDGYGGNEINSSLVVVGDNWWLERNEYDGSEWWEFKTIPTEPVNSFPLSVEIIKA